MPLWADAVILVFFLPVLVLFVWILREHGKERKGRD